MTRFLATLFLPGLIYLSAHSQTIIFPDLYGEELRTRLVEDYKPQSVLDYGDARDKMYALIDNHNDSLSGVYSGYTIYVPYNSPSPRDLTNAANPIINCEHTWPKSKGASGNAESDMHHLFPTNAVPNAARGNYPFAEIDDNLTDKWYRFTNVLSSIPALGIDYYSELDDNTSFEPPETHKGNVARAMFYFYTMYKSQADNADPNFFNVQKGVLRKWNSMDPVDEAEITRTNQIAQYQDNKPNPFVLDTTLIGRVYFGVTTSLQNAANQQPQQLILLQNYPNPFNGTTTIRYQLAEPGFVEISIISNDGKKIKNWYYPSQNSGNHTLRFPAQDLSSGIYYYSIRTPSGFTSRKMLYLK